MRTLANEIEAYERLLCEHLQAMTIRLRMLSEEQWDWSPAVSAPTARILAKHALQWLQCDRQHILNPDPSTHLRIPEPPEETGALCVALENETELWRTLIRGLTPEILNQPRPQFETESVLSIRWFLYHIIQNSIYKHGQFSTLFFALGLDGAGPYTAPFPNAYYEEFFGTCDT